MRLTSDFFASALVRRVFGLGGFAAIEKHGSNEAGAIFIRQQFRDGSETLYGPAPQTAFETGDSDDRRFEIRLQRAATQDVSDLLARETRFDSDLWIIGIELDDIGDLLAMT